MTKRGFAICDGLAPVSTEMSDDVTSAVGHSPELCFAVFPTLEIATEVMDALPGSAFHEGATGLVVRAVTVTIDDEILSRQKELEDQDPGDDEWH